MIPLRYSRDVELLRQYVGKIINSVNYCQYVFNGEPNRQDINALVFEFETGDVLTLDLSGDGQSVRVSNVRKLLPEPFDLGPNAHCEWKYAPLTEFGNHADFGGRSFSSVEAIIESLNGLPDIVSGWIVRFDDNNFLVFSNCGDQGCMSLNQYPDADSGLVSRREIVVIKK